MAYISIDYPEGTCLQEKKSLPGKLIMIFTEGTIMGPRHWWHWPFDKKYLPIKNSSEKIRKWKEQGAEIVYLTPRKKIKDVEKIKGNLLENGFPGSRLYYRGQKEMYKDIAENVIPAVLVEDDCRSIGGKWQMTITYVRNDIRKLIKSIVVKEFNGIDHLPDSLSDLLKYFHST